MKIDLYSNILTNTGTQTDLTFFGNPAVLTPLLDKSSTGSGTPVDPYVWSFAYEFSAAQVSTYNLPSSSDFFSCWSNPDPRINTSNNGYKNNIEGDSRYIHTVTPALASTGGDPLPYTLSRAHNYWKIGLLFTLLITQLTLMN